MEDEFFAGDLLADIENRWANRSSNPLPDPELVPVPQDEIIVNEKYERGSIISYRGDRWFVAQVEHENGTQVAPADIRDEMDESLPSGWNSWLVKVHDQALVTVSEEVQAGKATLLGSRAVRFDDGQVSFLTDLKYSSELGVYDKSKVSG